jgi:hypothetical protein
VAPRRWLHTGILAYEEEPCPTGDGTSPPSGETTVKASLEAGTRGNTRSVPLGSSLTDGPEGPGGWVPQGGLCCFEVVFVVFMAFGPPGSVWGV